MGELEIFLWELREIYMYDVDDDDDEEEDEDPDPSRKLILQDSHERDYAQTWLRRLIKYQAEWLDDPYDMIADLLEDAAAISERLTELAAGRGRMGGASEGSAQQDETLERSFTFPFDFERLGKKRKSVSSPTAAAPTSAGQQPRVNVTLIDEPLPPSGNDDTGANEADSAAEAVGVQTWAAAIILADLLVRTPGDMHKRLGGGGGKGINVAELGAGTGLVGIVCAQLLAAQQQQQARVNEEVSHRVVLTDYHSLVLANLRRNVAANPVASSSTSTAAVEMSVEALDWSHYYQEQSAPSPAATPSSSAPSGQQYDLLLAADVVYSPLHAKWLYSAMSSLLTQRPSARAHVINAKREQGRFGEWGLVRLTDEAFGPVWAEEEAEEGEWKLVVLKRTEMAKRKGLGRGDESGHVWWTLGWKRVKKSTGEGGAGAGEAA